MAAAATIIVGIIGAAATIGTAIYQDAESDSRTRASQKNANAQAKQQRVDWLLGKREEERRYKTEKRESERRYDIESRAQKRELDYRKKMNRENLNKQALQSAVSSLKRDIKDDAIYKQTVKGLFA